MRENASEQQRNATVFRARRWFLVLILAICSVVILPLHLSAATSTTSLLDISNWNVFFGSNAGMNSGLLTVGPSASMKSKQTYYQPVTFTWKGSFPLTSYSGNGAGIVVMRPPFDQNGYGGPSSTGWEFYADWVHPNAWLCIAGLIILIFQT
jgi:hypothetical protein